MKKRYIVLGTIGVLTYVVYKKIVSYEVGLSSPMDGGTVKLPAYKVFDDDANPVYQFIREHLKYHWHCREFDCGYWYISNKPDTVLDIMNKHMQEVHGKGSK